MTYDKERFIKLNVSMRYWLLGMSNQDKSFLLPLKAMEYAKNIHLGVRKDNITPEFQHQLEIAHYLRTLYHGLDYPAETLATCFLHDAREDYDIPHQEIESLFGAVIADATELLTKQFKGVKKNTAHYYEEMSKNPITSAMKGADRINNHQSMSGVFTKEKQQSYIQETKDYVLPMLKTARHLFITQEPIYENIKFVLQSQMQFVELSLKS